MVKDRKALPNVPFVCFSVYQVLSIYTSSREGVCVSVGAFDLGILRVFFSWSSNSLSGACLRRFPQHGAIVIISPRPFRAR